MISNHHKQLKFMHLFALLLNVIKFLLDAQVDRDRLPLNTFYLLRFNCCKGIKVQRRKVRKAAKAGPSCFLLACLFVCLFVSRGSEEEPVNVDIDSGPAADNPPLQLYNFII